MSVDFSDAPWVATADVRSSLSRSTATQTHTTETATETDVRQIVGPQQESTPPSSLPTSSTAVAGTVPDIESKSVTDKLNQGIPGIGKADAKDTNKGKDEEKDKVMKRETKDNGKEPSHHGIRSDGPDPESNWPSILFPAGLASALDEIVRKRPRAADDRIVARGSRAVTCGERGKRSIIVLVDTESEDLFTLPIADDVPGKPDTTLQFHRAGKFRKLQPTRDFIHEFIQVIQSRYVDQFSHVSYDDLVWDYLAAWSASPPSSTNDAGNAGNAFELGHRDTDEDKTMNKPKKTQENGAASRVVAPPLTITRFTPKNALVRDLGIFTSCTTLDDLDDRLTHSDRKTWPYVILTGQDLQSTDHRKATAIFDTLVPTLVAIGIMLVVGFLSFGLDRYPISCHLIDVHGFAPSTENNSSSSLSFWSDLCAPSVTREAIGYRLADLLVVNLVVVATLIRPFLRVPKGYVYTEDMFVGGAAALVMFLFFARVHIYAIFLLMCVVSYLYPYQDDCCCGCDDEECDDCMRMANRFSPPVLSPTLTVGDLEDMVRTKAASAGHDPYGGGFHRSYINAKLSRLRRNGHVLLTHARGILYDADREADLKILFRKAPHHRRSCAPLTSTGSSTEPWEPIVLRPSRDGRYDLVIWYVIEDGDPVSPSSTTNAGPPTKESKSSPGPSVALFPARTSEPLETCGVSSPTGPRVRFVMHSE